MTTRHDPPELSNEWHDDDRPSPRMARRARLLKVVGIIAVASLVLPGVLITWATSQATARAACNMAIEYYAPAAIGSTANFEVFPLSTFGWTCYAVMADGISMPVVSLGPIPGRPTFKPLTGV
jgi:hypothetical protein